MDDNKTVTTELRQLRDVLNKVINNTDKYSKQTSKSATTLHDLSASLSELNALNPNKSD